ncbi:hypothetical protein [Ferviditalea candida]|uniref:Spore germination protein GerPA/GerPF n=1 Tax=Ferviditalea candida TaxID=3108399 RepID=A0ABU5ZM35_9BACL|nr:hypothetical protein [Paenibacillaceae bacterium T2]
MPSFINIGVLNVNSPQQNSPVFIGESISSGWDANQKFNAAHGGTYGVGNMFFFERDLNFDPDVVDGNIFDQDFKPSAGAAV